MKPHHPSFLACILLNRKEDERLPKHNASYKYIVASDFSEEDDDDDYIIKHCTAKQKTGNKDIFDLMSRINMTRDTRSMDADERNIIPVSQKLVSPSPIVSSKDLVKLLSMCESICMEYDEFPPHSFSLSKGWEISLILILLQIVQLKGAVEFIQ